MRACGICVWRTGVGAPGDQRRAERDGGSRSRRRGHIADDADNDGANGDAGRLGAFCDAAAGGGVERAQRRLPRHKVRSFASDDFTFFFFFRIGRGV